MSVVAVKNNPMLEAVAWKSLKNLLEKFNFNEHEGQILMGNMPRSSYYKGLQDHKMRLTRDQMERISYLLGIYKSLRILFVDSAQAMSWIDRPNDLPPFNDMTPREFMLEGSFLRLAQVRQFLDFWRG